MPEPKTESEVELTWAQAWNNAPGPKSMREALTLFGKGLAMGTADIIPGVSGGTIAFITGIYHHLLSAISSINLSSIWLGLRGKFKEALVEIHLKFLIAPIIRPVNKHIVICSKRCKQNFNILLKPRIPIRHPAVKTNNASKCSSSNGERRAPVIN